MSFGAVHSSIFVSLPNSDLFANYRTQKMQLLLTHVSDILNREEEKAKERWCLFVCSNVDAITLSPSCFL